MQLVYRCTTWCCAWLAVWGVEAMINVMPAGNNIMAKN